MAEYDPAHPTEVEVDTAIRPFPQVLLDVSRDAMLVINGDGLIELANTAAADLLGAESVSLVGARFDAFLSREAQAVSLEDMVRRPELQAHVELVTSRGELRPCRLRLRSTALPGRHPEEMLSVYADWVVVLHDLRAEASSQEALALLQSFSEESPDALVRLDANGLVNYMNSRANHMAGDLELEIGKPPGGRLQELYEEARRTGTKCGDEILLGSRTVEVGVRPVLSGQCFHVYASDITARVQAEQELLQAAFYDRLTGLPNRILMRDHIDVAIRVQRRRGRRFALMAIDIDRFRMVNETFGHDVGDALLKEMGRLLQRGAAAGDIVARLNTDYFCLLRQVRSDHEDLVSVAADIISLFESPITIGSHKLRITVSIGLVISQGDEEDSEGLLRDTDVALYRAKCTGRGRYVLFEPEMRNHSSRMLEMEARLREAMEREAFELYYQPKVIAKTWQVAGFEALIRWRANDGGFVSPVEFIPVAEDTGLIVEIGTWVLRACCRQARAWQDAGHDNIRLAVNCSGEQFMRRDFVDQVREIIDETGVDPAAIELELTESVLVDDIALIVGKLKALAELGVKTSVDDFGTGYSSLSYLKSFPINYVKIDQSFVREMHVDEDDHAITAAIIAMAHQLGMGVVAEGAENEQQVRQLMQLGCELIQGYYFSPPLPLAMAEKLLRDGVMKPLKP